MADTSGRGKRAALGRVHRTSTRKATEMILSTILAALLTLAPGYNNTGAAGEVVAVSAATSNATATVAIKSVNTLTTYTNTTAQVVTLETAYALTYTNYDGAAAIATNVLGYVDYDYFKTNGVSKIIKGPVRFDMPITNTVVTGQAISGYYAATNDIGSVTTSAHFGQAAITNKVLLGGGVLVTGAAEGDIINILIK